jgi:hypothetical protein
MSQMQEPVPSAGLQPLLGDSLGTRSGHTAFEASSLGEGTKEPCVHHRVLKGVIFPAAGYIDMALRGFLACKGEAANGSVLEDVQFEHLLALEDHLPMVKKFWCNGG